MMLPALDQTPPEHVQMPLAPLPVLPTISQWPTTCLLVRSGRSERMGPSLPLRLLRHGYTPGSPQG
jgi:hypothetical protein